MEVSSDFDDDFSQQTDDDFGGNADGFDDDDDGFDDERHSGKFESEAEALTMLRDRRFRGWVVKWLEMAPGADSAVENASSSQQSASQTAAAPATSAGPVAEPMLIGRLRSVVSVRRDDLLGVFYVSVADAGDYLPDPAWCRGEQDGALDDDGAMFGSDDDGSQAVAVDSHAQSAQVRRFEQVRRLVQCDVDEVNAIPGISAGMWFPSVDAPKIHVWIAIDLEARYQLDPFRASAWMSDTSRRVVQRIDFAPGYTRDEMQPEVKKDKCGLTDVWNLNQRQLSLASPAQSAGMHHERDLESGGEIEGFGLQFVVNNAIKKSLVSHWPPPELNPREWERPEGARLHEEYRKVMEICRVSAPLAKRIYAYYKTRHGNIAGSTNEVWLMWDESQRAAPGSQMANDFAQLQQEASIEVAETERLAVLAAAEARLRVGPELSAADARRLEELEEQRATSVEVFQSALEADIASASELLGAKSLRQRMEPDFISALTLRAALGALILSDRNKTKAKKLLKDVKPTEAGAARVKELEQVWRTSQHEEWMRGHEHRKVVPFLIRQTHGRRGAADVARSHSGGGAWAANPQCSAHEISLVRKNEVNLRMSNILARVVLKVDEQFAKMATHCIICSQRLMYVAEGGSKVEYESVCPSACEAKTCQFAYITLGVGLELGSQIMRNNVFMNMLICFLHAAASDIGRVNLFFPSDLHATSSSGGDDSFGTTAVPNRPRLKLCLGNIPPLATMMRWAAAGIDADTRANVLFVELNKLDPLIVPLLRWMLATNNGYARMLTSEERLDVDTPYQFMLLTSSARKEAQFQAFKIETVKARRVMAKLKPAGRAKIVAALAAAKTGVVWSTKSSRAADGFPGFDGKDPLHEARGVLRIVLGCIARAHAERNAAIDLSDDSGGGGGSASGAAAAAAPARACSPMNAQSMDSTADEKAALKMINARKGSRALADVAHDVVQRCAADKNYWGSPGWGGCQAGPPGKTGVPGARHI